MRYIGHLPGIMTNIDLKGQKSCHETVVCFPLYLINIIFIEGSVLGSMLYRYIISSFNVVSFFFFGKFLCKTVNLRVQNGQYGKGC